MNEKHRFYCHLVITCAMQKRATSTCPIYYFEELLSSSLTKPPLYFHKRCSVQSLLHLPKTTQSLITITPCTLAFANFYIETLCIKLCFIELPQKFCHCLLTINCLLKLIFPEGGAHLCSKLQKSLCTVHKKTSLLFFL